MPARLALASLLFAVCLAPSAFATTSVPSPFNSTVPSCIEFCPAGELVMEIVVRDLANNTITGSTVVLDFSSCPTFVHCAPGAGDPFVYDDANRALRAVTNGSGSVKFAAKMGGSCPGQQLRVFADGVILAQPIFVSPDQNGDLVVNEADTLIANAKVAVNDRSADLDCNGFTTEDNVAAIEAHVPHACDHVSAPRRMSWGKLKIRYR